MESEFKFRPSRNIGSIVAINKYHSKLKFRASQNIEHKVATNKSHLKASNQVLANILAGLEWVPAAVASERRHFGVGLPQSPVHFLPFAAVNAEPVNCKVALCRNAREALVATQWLSFHLAIGVEALPVPGQVRLGAKLLEALGAAYFEGPELVLGVKVWDEVLGGSSYGPVTQVANVLNKCFV